MNPAGFAIAELAVLQAVVGPPSFCPPVRLSACPSLWIVK